MSLGHIGESLPKGWRAPLLSELTTPKQWKTISTKSLLSEGYTVYGANGKIGYFDQYTHEHPTIMITCRGATCGNLHISEPFSYINGNAMALDGQPTALVGLEFLYFALKARGLEDTISGSAQPQITGKGLSEVRLPLSPLAEQKVIADKLDTLLAQVENTKARLERIPQILKRFRQSVLAAAVSGRLTEGWRGNHDYKNLDLGLEKSNEDISYPEDWQTMTLADACTVISGNAFKSNEFTNVGSTPAIKISNVQYGSFEKKNQQYLPEEYLSIYQKFEVLPGDLLMALTRPITNDTLKICRYPISEPAGLLNQRVAKFLFHNERQKEFFELLFQSNYFKLQVYDKLSETLQPNLSPVDLKKFIIALPSRDEQTEVVRRVDQLFAHADRIEQQANNALARVNNLTQSILAKAFRGELTEQWREDNLDLISGVNSAEALLEKIKSERENLKKKPKPKGTSAKKRIANKMSKEIIKVADALREANQPLSGQQLLAAAGYPNDAGTEDLEKFFLDIRNALVRDKSIVKLKRSDDGQDWFAFAETAKQA